MCQWSVGEKFEEAKIRGAGNGRNRLMMMGSWFSSDCRFLLVVIYVLAILNPEVSAQLTTSTPASTNSTGSVNVKKLATAPATVSWGSGVKITSLRVPHVVRNGSENGASLDCEFSVSRDAEAGLVVKWFLNNGPAPVYQWIPGNGIEGGKLGSTVNGGGQGFGPLKGKLDLGFVHHHSAPAGGDGTVVTPSSLSAVENAVNGLEESVGRQHLSALRIRKPTTDLSGDYKCSVSTFHDEDSMVKRMLVFAPEKSMELWQSRAKVPTGDGAGDGTTTSYLNVTCHARGIYPEPKMALLREPPTLLEAEGSGNMEGSGSDSGVGVGIGAVGGTGGIGSNGGLSEVEAVGGSTSVETTWRPEAGVFDIRASESLPETTLASPTVFHCELRIPEADYSVRRSIVYYPGSPDLSNHGASIHRYLSSYWILTLICFSLGFSHLTSTLPLSML